MNKFLILNTVFFLLILTFKNVEAKDLISFDKGKKLYEIQKYDEAKKYLQKAVKLMPSDPVINDHFADTLWMNGEKIQARYYWKYVLSLEKTKISLKDKIAKKILNGPASLN